MQTRVLILFLFIHFAIFSQENITLISWNIQDLGRTKNDEELEAIAQIIRDADIVAIQEVVAGYGGAQAVARLHDLLNRKGSNWDYVISNPTSSPKYASERYAIFWKTSKVKIKNRGALLSSLAKVVDREPFYLDFYLGDQKFSILNFHSRPHNKYPEEEIKHISRFLQQNDFNHPIILAGDFNLDESDAVFDDLKATGFNVAITNTKTTLKRSCSDDYLSYAIDNIFYSSILKLTTSGSLDYVKSCEHLEEARKLSDHLPIYAAFEMQD